MKKKFILLIMLIFIFILTGCGKVSENKVLKIVDAGIKKGIVSSDYKLYDVVTHTYDNSPFGVNKIYTYIYKNNSSKLIGINVSKAKNDDKKYYIIYIYKDVIMDDSNIEYIYEKDEDGKVPWQYLGRGYYEYRKGYPSVKNKYDILRGDLVKYNVYETKDLFGNVKYKFEKVNEDKKDV